MSNQEKKNPPRPIAAFYEFIQMLRMSAMAKYEIETAKGTPSLELAEKLKPTMDTLEAAQHEASENDFDGVCHAVIQFELDADAFEEHAKYLQTKAADCRAHGDKLRTLLMERMDFRKEATYRGLFHSAAIIVGISGKKQSRNLVVR